MDINTVNSEKTKKWYDENALEYTSHVRDQNDSVYHHHYEKPAMYNLLPTNMKAMKVLSLGCGSGEDCNELQKRGAEVYGIDISSKLIEQAQSKYPNCQFAVGNMEDLSAYKNSEFDLIYSSLAVHYLKDWSLLLAEVNRVLKPRSKFQISMGHPMRMGMVYRTNPDGTKFKGIGRNKNTELKELDIIGDYFAQGPTPALGSADGPECYGKTTQELLQLCKKYGFSLENVVDPKPLESMKTISPSDFEVLQKIPEFCIYEFIKE